MLGLLTAYGPLVIKLGIFLIDKFIGDSSEKAKAKKQFLEAIQVHIDRVSESLALTNNVNDQLNDLRKKP